MGWRCQRYQGHELPHSAAKVYEKERKMGPIEMELRKLAGDWCPNYGYWGLLSDEAFDVTLGASVSIGSRKEFVHAQTADAEVLSEAIEAAEALNL